MTDWPKAQRDIAAALVDACHDDQAARWIDGDPANARARLSIYRANVAAAAAKALANTYPVVRQVVGDEFFDGLARAYQRRHPSTSGDLNEYGGAFGSFLAAFEPAARLVYLPDLARLEWAANCAYGAADAAPWDAAALESVPPERQADIRFEFAPGCALLASEHPVVRIWQIHQPDHVGAFEVDWSRAETAWVTRRDLRVEVQALAPGAAAFIGATTAGAPLGDALSRALAADGAFDLGVLLAQWVAARLLTGFTLVPAAAKELQ